jgi:glyoxylase-like metal-dependent hydrolase (beta-lactamase superfamily II)
MWDNYFDENGNNIWLQFDRKDLPTFKKYEIVGVPDGYNFNLGGDYEVELVFTGGHAEQHAMYLDKKGGYLFAGDVICSDVTGCGNGGGYANLTTYRDALNKLVDRLDEFEYIFPMHFMVNLENNLVVTLRNTLNEIITDPTCFDYTVERVRGNGTTMLRMHKFIPGFSTIAYTENGIYPPGG